MADVFKYYKNDDGTVSVVVEGSPADQILSTGSDTPSDVPALETTVNDSGAIDPNPLNPSQGGSVERRLVQVRNLGQENINLDDPVSVQWQDSAQFQVGSKELYTPSIEGVRVSEEGLYKVETHINFWTEGTEAQRAAPQLKITVDREASKSTGRQSLSLIHI